MTKGEAGTWRRERKPKLRVCVCVCVLGWGSVQGSKDARAPGRCQGQASPGTWACGMRREARGSSRNSTLDLCLVQTRHTPVGVLGR